jgi:hypothetical protein
MIPFAIVSVGVGIFMIATSIDTPSFFTVFVVGIVSFGTFFLYRYIVPRLLDLQEEPTEVEGSLSDKRRGSHVSSHGSHYSYHLRIDTNTLAFELECGKKEWDMVKEGDKVSAVYHRRSKQIESITVLEKTNGYNVHTGTSRFVGDQRTYQIHKLSCRLIMHIESNHMIWFETEDEAKTLGYSKCEHCMS